MIYLTYTSSYINEFVNRRSCGSTAPQKHPSPVGSNYCSLVVVVVVVVVVVAVAVAVAAVVVVVVVIVVVVVVVLVAQPTTTKGVYVNNKTSCVVFAKNIRELIVLASCSCEANKVGKACQHGTGTGHDG